jgi:ADP-heptose:LPS heptosyltransferase
MFVPSSGERAKVIPAKARSPLSDADMKLSDKKPKTAILFQNGSVGDFLMFIFLAELLQKSGCVDRCTIVVPRNLNFLRGLIGAYPYISAIQVSRRSGWGHILKTMRGASLVVVQPTLGRIPFRIKALGWFISRSRGTDFIGFQDKGPLCKALYSRTLIYNTDQLHSENLQKIVRALGAPVLVQIPDLKITADLRPVQACGLNHRPYMVFHPGASAPKRSFTVRAAQEVIEHVFKRNSEMHVVLSGSSTEGKWIDEIRNRIREKDRIVNAIGCSAQEIAAFIQSAEFFIGTDTGITHLACFLRARVIVAAHYGTANWLPFYCPTATVVYHLEEENSTHQSREYLDRQRRGRVKPLGTVPTHAICAVVDQFVGRSRNKEETARELVFGQNGNHLCNAR